MKYLKENKIIGCIGLLVIFIISSFFLYGNLKEKVFKDEYMKEIFVEEERQDSDEEVLLDTKKIEKSKEQIVVEVKGEVTKPNVYFLEDGSIIKDLIDIAGGITEEGDISCINRAEVLKNHQLIIIPNKNEIVEDGNPNIQVLSQNPQGDDGVININTATLDDLKKINGIGDSKAQSIIDYRESNNGFKSIEEIKNVDGIGEKTFEKLKDKITV